MLFAYIFYLLLMTKDFHAVLTDGEGENFAFGKSTWQSSLEADGVSSRAVDGYRHPDYSQNSCMQTKTQYEPWWAVDLEHEYFVTSVHITNRADCCWRNLVNFNIRVGGNSTDGGKHNPQCGPTYIYEVGAGQTLPVKCMPPLLGQYVTVSITGAHGTLNFCEVEVYGYQRHNVFRVKAISYGSKDVEELGKVSQLIVGDTYNQYLSSGGHHVVSFNMTTGLLIASKHFDTQHNSKVLTDMPLYLNNLPSEIFVFVIMQNGGWNYYRTSIPMLKDLSGSDHISEKLAWGDAWALLGYNGQLPSPSWRTSVMKNLGYTPAVIENVIPKLLVPPRPPSSIIVVDLASSSFTLRWSRPSGIVTENELPLNYTICVRGTGTVGSNCTNNGGTRIYTTTGLKPQTEYHVSVRSQSYAGFGTEAAVYVTTMKQDTFRIYVELVSRVKPDTLYRIDADSFSSITIRGTQHKFSQPGHHFIVLDPKTGIELMRGSFNTFQDAGSLTKMAEFLSSIPKPSIILMVVYFQAHNYYAEGSLQSVCPNAPTNYTSVKSWSMICLHGFGTLPWETSATSSGDKGPAVIKTHISLPKELKNAPVIQNVIVTSSRSLQLYWISPSTDEYTGSILNYQICYQKSTDQTNCSLVSVSVNLTQAVISSLHPFQEYEVKIRGVVALGYGPYSNLFTSTTHEAEPSSGPTNLVFPDVSSTSIFLSWSRPPEQERNGIILHYSVYCHSDGGTNDPCGNETITSNMWYRASGLKPYQEIRFEIKAATSVGFGPATVAYERTLQSAPDGPPNEARTTFVQATKMSLSWSPPDPELCNGIIVNYSICIRVHSSSPVPCLMEIMLDKRMDYTVTNLKPYTKYGIEISAGTEAGFGPPAMLVNTTLQTAPSVPPTNLQVTYFTHNVIDVAWSSPDHSEINGILTQYSVCIRKQSSDSCLHEVTVPPTRTSYRFSDLKPYVVYSIEISAATLAGYGPQANISQITEQTEPSGPPTGKSVIFVNESAISFSWSEPEPELQNGAIIHYRVCIREYGIAFTCTRATQVPASDRNNYTFGGLNPVKEYVVSIEAATKVGFGPPAFLQKTSGECDLPILHSGGHVADDSFSASGFLSRNYEPYQARIDNYLPWCDEGTRNIIYLQVDLGGPLKILGVATKGHRQHWESWVSSYKVFYSMDGVEWKYVNVSGNMVIKGNNGKGEEVKHFLDNSVVTRFIRFQVHTFVGLHPCIGVEIYGCAPAIKPTKASVVNRNKDLIEIGWTPLPSVIASGKIFGYKVCHKLSSSLLPCETSSYVSHTASTYSIGHLTPYTDYSFEVSAGTIAGYGPPVVLHAKTLESSPSGPPRLVMTKDVTPTSLKLVWSPPEEYQRRATAAGEGPRTVLYETTLPTVPSGPPTSVYASRFGPRIVQIFWRPPEAKKQNGVIIGYRLCIKEKSFTTPCRKYVTLPETQLMHTIDGLKPYTLYNIHVEAKTALGYGPAHYFDYRTGQAAPSAPPKDVTIRSTTSSSIEIIWTAPDIEKQNGILAMYEVVVYQELSDSKVEKISSSSMSANTTIWKVDNLSPLTDYIFHIKAGTVEGFGPAVIVHKRSDGRIPKTGKHSEGKFTAGGIAGGSIMLAVLIAGLILSILWNKGMLPYTRTRKLKLESEEKQRRRRRKQRRRKRRRDTSTPRPEAVRAEIHETNSIYSELNDYDAPKKVRKHITAEELYGTTACEDIYSKGITPTPPGIYAPIPNVLSHDIYGTSVATSSFSSAPRQTDIYGIAPAGMIAGIQKSNTILPPIVAQPSVLPPPIPLEATLSSVFIDLSSTKLDSPDSGNLSSRSNTILNSSRALSNATFLSASQMGTSNQVARGTTSTTTIPQPSQFSQVFSHAPTPPAIRVDKMASSTNASASAISDAVTATKTDVVESNSSPIAHRTASLNDRQRSHITAACPKLIAQPVPHQPSIPVPSMKKKSVSTVRS
ncbi:phosphatidylinositol phosphatase PTPRQ-like [Dendronephthya gigantea]|uniref:phosphatidylinositol phosphatase PTPRQ-like n=1 Tax=Dendronephthya gigantea TaxID=151771 RepID=UPI00106A3A7C|nr:phosphatidylinositol phosphatase PTPRQ-like [Dendronephthya gigantea]